MTIIFFFVNRFLQLVSLRVPDSNRFIPGGRSEEFISENQSEVIDRVQMCFDLKL